MCPNVAFAFVFKCNISLEYRSPLTKWSGDSGDEGWWWWEEEDGGEGCWGEGVSRLISGERCRCAAFLRMDFGFG